ncbi:MAG: hypothetical protein U1E74_01215 [Paenacidovorax caeni]
MIFLKIIFLLLRLLAGGAEQVAYLLASALVKNGHEIIVATPLAVGEFAENSEKNAKSLTSRRAS